jgi:hypothetical protein
MAKETTRRTKEPTRRAPKRALDEHKSVKKRATRALEQHKKRATRARAAKIGEHKNTPREKIGALETSYAREPRAADVILDASDRRRQRLARLAKRKEHATSIKRAANEHAVLMVRVPKKKIGRPKGSPNAIPAQVRASIKAVIEEVVSERQLSIRDALVNGIESGPRNADRYLRLCADYTDGKPDATLNLRTNFKEDELAAAQRTLAKKMDTLFARAALVTVLDAPEEDAIDHQ